ncbi:MAG TPA: hypothetical protein VMV03_17710, partial [Spirochaetia bacterium]|nr:hypothetical protein [Spirochaetia bacterium]
MTCRKALVFTLLVMLGLAGGLWASPGAGDPGAASPGAPDLRAPDQGAPDPAALLKKLDEQTNFRTDFTAEYTEVAEHPGQQPSLFKHDVYRRDRDGAMTIIMLA